MTFFGNARSQYLCLLASVIPVRCMHVKSPRLRRSIASNADEGSRISFGFSLLFQLQDTRAQRIERLFGRVAEQWILVNGQGRRDLRPVLSLQSLERSR